MCKLPHAMTHPNHGKLTSAAALIRILIRYSWKQHYFHVFFVVHFTGDGDEKSSQSEMARWSHEYNSAHQRKCAEFNEFKTLYRERVAPALRGEEALHKASGQGGTAAKDLDLDLQRLREAGQKLKKAVSDLESRRAWNEGEGLTKAIAELETAVRKVEKLMHDGKLMDSQIKPWPNGAPHSSNSAVFDLVEVGCRLATHLARVGLNLAKLKRSPNSGQVYHL